jgi:hypothetical protein
VEIINRFLLGIISFIIIVGCSNQDRLAKHELQPSVPASIKPDLTDSETPQPNINVSNDPKILEPELNTSCNEAQKYGNEISEEFIKLNIRFGIGPDDVSAFFGHPCGLGENALNALTEWRYDYYADKNYKFMPDTQISMYDDIGLKSGKMRLQLFIGWLDNKSAYYSIFYISKDGEIINSYDAPEELKNRVFEVVDE